jgi:serine/threonine-protein kinase
MSTEGMEPGKQITDNVRLTRKLGEGGMGSVWVAEHLTLHTQVAVKFMSLELAQDPGAVQRFTREATAAAQVKSPHIVQTYDHGLTPDGIPYIVMELLEGEDLGHRIDRHGPLSPIDASTVITQACKALGKAHSLGIVHRDIKPDNLFLMAHADNDLFVKVLDFGIAKKQADDFQFGMTKSGVLVGTPYFMSPEQLRSSKSVDHRADLWSLSVVAYVCVTGQVPFDADNFAALCIAIDKGKCQKPSEIRPDLPHALDPFFEKALSPDIERRFQSARELADSFAIAVDAYRPSMPMPVSLPAHVVPAVSVQGPAIPRAARS